MALQTTRSTNLTTIRGDYPGFDREYNNNWRVICKKRLNVLVARNSKSSRLTGVKEEARNTFSHFGFDEKALKVIQDSISQKFRNSLGLADWDEYRDKLPNIFAGADLDDGKMLTVFETAEDGSPSLIKQVPKTVTKTFTVSFVSDDGKQVHTMPDVPKDIAMTCLSEISKALA